MVPDPTSADLSPPLGALPDRDASRVTPWAWILAALLLLLGAGPFAWRAWRGRRVRVDARTAYELAREDLEGLLTHPRSTPEEIDVFFVRLSGIVRRYLERRFSIRSPELTTERFLEQVSHSPELSRAHRELLADFLRQSDLVKFAHLIPAKETIEQTIASASRFLDETRDDLPTGVPDTPGHEEPG